jgi:hypothetical protein
MYKDMPGGDSIRQDLFKNSGEIPAEYATVTKQNIK